MKQLTIDLHDAGLHKPNKEVNVGAIFTGQREYVDVVWDGKLWRNVHGAILPQPLYWFYKIWKKLNDVSVALMSDTAEKGTVMTMCGSGEIQMQEAEVQVIMLDRHSILQVNHKKDGYDVWITREHGKNEVPKFYCLTASFHTPDKHFNE